MCADALVSIYKWMIFYQTKTKVSSFLLERWVDIFSIEGLERGI